jgi:hypothetical protein
MTPICIGARLHYIRRQGVPLSDYHGQKNPSGKDTASGKSIGTDVVLPILICRKNKGEKSGVTQSW